MFTSVNGLYLDGSRQATITMIINFLVPEAVDVLTTLTAITTSRNTLQQGVP
jgi:hypothetical protein